jgi:uncharacterized repeat protein (TIGR02543 family)
MVRERVFHSATLLSNGKVLVAGGFGNSTYWSSVELFDPSSGTWAATDSMGTTRAYHTATLLQNGKVLVAGGFGTGSTYLKSAELFDPSSGTWTSTGSMGTARRFHTAILLSNGKVLVVGGSNSGSTYLKSAELYDPSSGTWTATDLMGTARYDHTATLLSNGKVLVAGGFGTGSTYLKSAELYGCLVALNPAEGTVSPGTKTYYLETDTYGSLPSPDTRTGYTFSGWWTGASGSGTQVTSGTALTAASDHTLYAKWTPNTYTVTFNPQGGETPVPSSKSVTYASTYGALADVTRFGYTLLGWWTGANGTGAQVISSTSVAITDSQTLYAKWTPTLTSQGVPWLWLDGHGIVSGGDFEAAAETDSDGDGYPAWQEYLAGSDPTNITSVLKAMIGVDGSSPLVSWSPDLRPDRIYTVVGKTNLTDTAWGPTNAASRFFKVNVDMP